MRGKVVDSEVRLCRHGITPAYAGKSTLTEGWAAGT